MSENDKSELNEIVEHLHSEADGTFDQHKIVPHKLLISKFNSVNSAKLASKYIDIINEYNKSDRKNTILMPISRVLSRVHTLEYFDRKRIYKSLVDLSISLNLASLEKSALLDCINVLGIKVERGDLILLEDDAAKGYPYQWCVALVRCGKYQELRKFLNDLLNRNILTVSELKMYLDYIRREVPENNEILFSQIQNEHLSKHFSEEEQDNIEYFYKLSTRPTINIDQERNRSFL